MLSVSSVVKEHHGRFLANRFGIIDCIKYGRSLRDVTRRSFKSRKAQWVAPVVLAVSPVIQQWAKKWSLGGAEIVRQLIEPPVTAPTCHTLNYG